MLFLVIELATGRSLAVCAARDDSFNPLPVRYGEQMNVERDAVASAQGVLAVGKNFDPGKEAGEQSQETRAGEEILVVALEQMPGNNPPVVEIRQQFHVRDGEERAMANAAGNFPNESFGILRVFDDLDANGSIEFRVRTRQPRAFQIDPAKRQLAAPEDRQAIIARFKAKPLVAGCQQRRSKSARAAADIEDRTSDGEISSEQFQNFDARFLDWRTGPVNVFAMQKRFVSGRDNVAVGTVSQGGGDNANGSFRQRAGIGDSGDGEA
jgi:hypothetical protein